LTASIIVLSKKNTQPNGHNPNVRDDVIGDLGDKGNWTELLRQREKKEG